MVWHGMVKPTSLEKMLMKALNEAGITDYEFQFPTHSGFIIDFAWPEKRLGVEADGPFHNKRRDAFRDWMLKREGWKILRFDAETINNNIEQVIKTIKVELRKR